MSSNSRSLYSRLPAAQSCRIGISDPLIHTENKITHEAFNYCRKQNILKPYRTWSNMTKPLIPVENERCDWPSKPHRIFLYFIFIFISNSFSKSGKNGWAYLSHSKQGSMPKQPTHTKRVKNAPQFLRRNRVRNSQPRAPWNFQPWPGGGSIMANFLNLK